MLYVVLSAGEFTVHPFKPQYMKGVRRNIGFLVISVFHVKHVNLVQ